MRVSRPPLAELQHPSSAVAARSQAEHKLSIDLVDHVLLLAPLPRHHPPHPPQRRHSARVRRQRRHRRGAPIGRRRRAGVGRAAGGGGVRGPELHLAMVVHGALEEDLVPAEMEGRPAGDRHAGLQADPASFGLPQLGLPAGPTRVAGWGGVGSPGWGDGGSSPAGEMHARLQAIQQGCKRVLGVQAGATKGAGGSYGCRRGRAGHGTFGSRAP